VQLTWLVGKGTKAAVCEHVRLAWVRFGSLDLLFCAAVVDTFLALPQAQQLGLARNRHTGVRRDGLQVRQPVADKHDARVRPQAASGSRLAN
jgi:hypothetical protein